MSKGSKRRPMKISEEEFAKRWDSIFGLWFHECTNGIISTKNGEACPRCGRTEKSEAK